VAKPLVVGVVISLNAPTVRGASLVPYPFLLDVPSWSSMSPGSSTPEGMNFAHYGGS
jgi:hypothetical protein